MKEFYAGMEAMRVGLSVEDSKVLFNRFETRVRDGNIDWLEFMDFFDRTRVQDKLVALFTLSKQLNCFVFCRSDSSKPGRRPIQYVVAKVSLFHSYRFLFKTKYACCR